MVEIDHTCKSLKILNCLDTEKLVLPRLCLEVVLLRIDRSGDQETQFDDPQTDICPHLPPNQSLQVVKKATAGGFCVPPEWN